jgi:hypothetical protein
MPDRPHLLALLAGLIACCCLSLSAAESATDDEADDDEPEETERRRDVEEMIVTGSHIRRDNFDLPSPMDVIGELDLQMAGTPDLGDVIFDQTYQIGVNANTNTSESAAPTARAAAKAGTRASIARTDLKAVRPTPTCGASAHAPP